jgi:hypothetical protein
MKRRYFAKHFGLYEGLFLAACANTGAATDPRHRKRRDARFIPVNWCMTGRGSADIVNEHKRPALWRFHPMKVVIRFTVKQEAKALPIILRHSPGMILPDRTYVLPEDVVRQLREAKIKFTEVSRDSVGAQTGAAGERI